MQATGTWKKILCVRMDNLGDILMTEPAIRALQEASPGREIHLLCTPAAAALEGMLPAVSDRLIAEPFWMEPDAARANALIQELVSRIRTGNYDAAVIFNVYSQSPMSMATVLRMAGIPYIAAFAKENPYNLISHWLPDPEPFFLVRHEVERQLALVEALGAHVKDDRITIRLDGEAMTRAEEKAESLTGGQPFILMHPGASENRRRYPAALFAQAASLIRKRTGYRVLLTGSPQERTLVHHVAALAGDGAVAAAGRFSLPEFVALIAMAPALVSNNTGPVHLAAASGTPVVVLYARTNPQHQPWRTNSIVLPFDVPQKERSLNTLVAFAHSSSFRDPVPMPQPSDILDAVQTLVLQEAFPNRKLLKRA